MTNVTTSNASLERKVRALSHEVARLRAIVDWEKALEDAPTESAELRPEFVKKLAKQIVAADRLDAVRRTFGTWQRPLKQSLRELAAIHAKTPRPLH